MAKEIKFNPNRSLEIFSCKKSDYSRRYHRYSICLLTQYASFVQFQDKMKAKFSNDRFGFNIKLLIDDKEQLVTASTSAKELRDNLDAAKSSVAKFRRKAADQAQSVQEHHTQSFDTQVHDDKGLQLFCDRGRSEHYMLRRADTTLHEARSNGKTVRTKGRSG